MSNLDRIWQEQTARFAWIKAMFATPESRLLFAAALLAAFIAGVLV